MQQPEKLSTPFELDAYYVGPHLDQGPRPSIFYFALSGLESLTLDPFNQPVVMWERAGLRVFSVDLPAHSLGCDPTVAMQQWYEGLKNDPYFLEKFITKCTQIIRYFIDRGFLTSHQIGVAGLSRGGFIASMLAASESSISTLLGFAPLTDLSLLQEYREKDILSLPTHQVSSLAPNLVHKYIAYFIGNRDVRVNTEACFRCVHTLTETAYAAGVRSPQISLQLFPSIGHKGHGTPPEIFESGATWMMHQLNQTGS